MASKIEIYNRALQEFQELPITSLSDDNERRKTIDGFYDSVRQEVLIERKWTFAFQTVSLAPVELPDVYDEDWEFAYAYPFDSLQLGRIFEKGGRDCGHIVRLTTDQLSQQSRIILTNSDLALASYVLDITNTALFTPLFTQAFVLKLAASIVIPLTNQLPAKGVLLALYEGILAKADKSDARDSKDRVPKPLTVFAAARIGAGINPDACLDESTGTPPHLQFPFV